MADREQSLQLLEDGVLNLLGQVRERIQAGTPNLQSWLGRTCNEAFPLRLFLSFSASAEGDEVAITVDVMRRAAGLSIESEIGTGKGRIVAAGPGAVVPAIRALSAESTETERWLSDFAEFLDRSESTLQDALRALD